MLDEQLESLASTMAGDFDVGEVQRLRGAIGYCRSSGFGIDRLAGHQATAQALERRRRRPEHLDVGEGYGTSVITARFMPAANLGKLLEGFGSM